MLLCTIWFCTVKTFENIGPMSCLTVQGTSMDEALESLVTLNAQILASLDVATFPTLMVTRKKTLKSSSTAVHT